MACLPLIGNTRVAVQCRMTPMRTSITGSPLSATRISASMSGRVSSASGSLVMYSAASLRVMNAQDEGLEAKLDQPSADCNYPGSAQCRQKITGNLKRGNRYKDGECRSRGRPCSQIHRESIFP
jgi:hypothetical protein